MTAILDQRAGARQPSLAGGRSRSGRIDDAVILALLVLLPLNKIYWDIGVRVRPWYLVAPVALAMAARRVRADGTPLRRPVLVLLGGLWLVALGGLASGLWAIDQAAFLKNIGDLLLGITAASAVALAGLGPRRAERVVGWWIAIGVAMSVYGLAQYVAGTAFGINLDAYTVERISTGLRRSGIDVYASYLRINSLIEDSSNYSLYLCTVWPLILFRFLWGDRASRRVVRRRLVAFALVALNLVLTLSRSGILGSVAGGLLAVVVVLHTAEMDRQRRGARRRQLTVAPARLAALVLAAAGGVLLIIPATVANILDLRTQNSEGTQFHFSALQDSLHLMLTRPWGVGLGGYRVWYQRYRRPWEDAKWSTFNSYTDAGASAGVVALAGYLIVLGGLAVALWRATGRWTGGARADAAGGLVALSAVAVGAFGYNAFANGYFMGFLGVAAAIACRGVERTS
jgi:hypothetical protein